MRKGFWFGLLAVVIAVAAACSGCGKTDASVRIIDRGVVTEDVIGLPETVAKILEEEDIVLNDGDVTIPALDEKLTEAGEIRILRKTGVKLTVDKETRDVTVVGATVADVLSQEGIEVGEDQHLYPAEDTPLKEGMEIIVSQVYTVVLTADGAKETVQTETSTVEEFLEEQKITLGEFDRLEPEADTAISDGLSVVVKRVTQEEVVTTDPIPFETFREDDASLTKGTENVVTAGEEGEKTLTWRITYVDGEEESYEIIKEEVTREPVAEVIHVGTKVVQAAPAQTAPSGPYEVSRTPYPNCDDGSHGYYEIVMSDGSVRYQEY